MVSFECFDVIGCHVTTSGISAVNGVSHLKLNPPAHRPFSRIDSQLEELPVWSLCSLQLNGVSFKENNIGLIVRPWLCLGTARM